MKKFLSTLSVISLLFAFSAKADFTGGFSLIVGSADTDGTETEKTVTGVTSQKTPASVSEDFVGASLFAEYGLDNGMSIGVDYVPLDIQLGAKSRTDTAGTPANDDDTGARSAEANVEGLITVYAHVPIGPVYGIVGYHSADVTTSETLPTSKYGDVSINGYQVGVGVKSDKLRLELAYSDFDDIEITATGNTISGDVKSQNKVSADADVLAAKLSIAF